MIYIEGDDLQALQENQYYSFGLIIIDLSSTIKSIISIATHTFCRKKYKPAIIQSYTSVKKCKDT